MDMARRVTGAASLGRATNDLTLPSRIERSELGFAGVGARFMMSYFYRASLFLLNCPKLSLRVVLGRAEFTENGTRLDGSVVSTTVSWTCFYFDAIVAAAIKMCFSGLVESRSVLCCLRMRSRSLSSVAMAELSSM